MNKSDVLAQYPPAHLENWYRFNYFNNEIDISGSGVEDYSFAEMRALAGIQVDDLDQLMMHDTPTVGEPTLRQVIADTYGDGDADKVMVCNGSNEALQLVIRSILQPGDELITLRPCYHCHDKIAESMGCKVQAWQLDSDQGFEVSLDELKQSITPNCKAMVLNFPHNPSGTSITQQQLDKVIELAKQHDLYLVWDAAFQTLVYDQPPLRDPILDYSKAISVNTFSKAHGLPGLRFGWFIAPQQVIAGAVRQKDYGNLFVSPVIEVLACKVLQNVEKFTLPRYHQAKENRELVDNWVSEQAGQVSWNKPAGGVCSLLQLPASLQDEEFCTGLLKRYGVLLVPGSCFGCPGYVRLGFGGNQKDLEEGLNRLSIALQEGVSKHVA